MLCLAGSLFLVTDAFGHSPGLWDDVRAHVAHDKTGLGWIRMVHFLALAYAVYYLGLTKLLRTTPIFAPLALIGRHSLPVFAVGAFLTLIGEAIMEAGVPNLPGQVIIVGGGIAIQFWVARYFEARAVRRKALAVAAPDRQAPAGAEPRLGSAGDGTSLAT